MTLKAGLFLGVALVATPWLTTAVVSAADAPPPQSAPNPPPAANACPPGTHWEPAGYVHDGKWRDARCAKDGGRE